MTTLTTMLVSREAMIDGESIPISFGGGVEDSLLRLGHVQRQNTLHFPDKAHRGGVVVGVILLLAENGVCLQH